MASLDMKLTLDHPLAQRLIDDIARLESALRERDQKAVTVWRYDEAPAELQAMSQNGGDEDWLAVLPPGQTAPVWASPGSLFGVCSVDEYELPDGSTVLIGCHA